MTGNAPKRVIVRGLGPSLATQNISDPLADPVIELHGPNGSLIQRNDDWKDSQRAAIEHSTLAPKDDKEAAIIATLPPGIYTAIVSGKNNTGGTALVEIYDLTPAGDSTLANISTRGYSAGGEKVLIGGFMLKGGGSSHVVVRGLGPSLTDAGISHALADPTLEVRNANGDAIGFNDNWKDDPLEAAAVTATGLAPKKAKEAALALDLPAGDYTVIVAGKASAAGIALVEVYNLQ